MGKALITVLGKTLEVVYLSPQALEIISGSPTVLGYFDEPIIYVRNDLTQVQKERVFLHEVTHAILTTGGLSCVIKKKVEEGICNAMECFRELLKDEAFMSHFDPK